MSKPTIRIHNSQTNEVIDREMTDAEFEQYKAQKAIDEARAADITAKETAKAALLTKLGITADEAALLLA
jgi:phosphopantetheinyl transferase (holo-ACP synthase)